jgi:hypothetical protein
MNYFILSSRVLLLFREFLEEEERKIRYSGVNLIIFPPKNFYSSWPKHVKYMYSGKKGKRKEKK